MTEAKKASEYEAADWLRDTVWYWFVWKPPHANWNHDHCFFCHMLISDDRGYTDALRECWRYDYPLDAGNYETMCENCFAELRDTFRWQTEEVS